ncbi:MAG TPA: DUF4244 domain-containing protein [Frankiaceae bacterium]|nr:DUF4244 domain-containing protein [Frankiaceae bacterium]
MARLRRIRERREAGVATAEYAVATVAACGFGGVLVTLLKSEAIVSLLTKTIAKAFNL